VPFLDVRAAYAELSEQIDAAVRRVAASGRYILGEEVEAFEGSFAEYVGTRHCIGVGSGLAALQFALLAMGVGKGDEVIVPSNTFVGTWMAVTHTGATPVPVEPDEGSYNIDPGRVEGAITPRTKAIVPVHLYGQPADMSRLTGIARRHGLQVLEDAAQAHGARHRGRRAGSLGDAAAWSFYPGKNLGALGDAGAVTTDDDAIADQVRLLRNYGWRERLLSECVAFNQRLDEVQAAVLRVKLPYLDEWNRRRARVAAAYREALDGVGVILPQVEPGMEPAWHVFAIRSRARDAMVGFLRRSGVEAAIHYPFAPHLQPAYARSGYGVGSLPVSERLHAEVLSLPIGPHLPEAAVRIVVDAVQAFDGAPRRAGAAPGGAG
jgi:dTDP-4-amino-4,6-dideoxygalactose transaminase